VRQLDMPYLQASAAKPFFFDNLLELIGSKSFVLHQAASGDGVQVLLKYFPYHQDQEPPEQHQHYQPDDPFGPALEEDFKVLV
jgi:hypothetical protein